MIPPAPTPAPPRQASRGERMLAGGVAGVLGLLLARWILANREDVQFWLLVAGIYIVLPIVLLWIVVRVVRHAWR